MEGLITFWTHALAAALFASLLLWELRRGRPAGTQRYLLSAFGMTAVWAWLSAVAPDALSTDYAETARNLIWVGVLYRLSQWNGADARQRGVLPVYVAVAAVLGMHLLIGALPLLVDTSDPASARAMMSTALLLRITAAAGALVLVHNLYGQSAPSSRGEIRLAMLALALMWGFDLNLYTLAYLDISAADYMWRWRGLALALVAPLFALSAGDGQGWRIKLSRAATFQSISLLAICVYFAGMILFANAVRGIGLNWARAAGIGLLIPVTVAAIALLMNARARAWTRTKVAKHFFEHRYDYRAEWLRFTDTIGAWGPDAPPLGERIVKAFAAILESPGGLLLVTNDSGSLEPAAAWNWRGDAAPARDAPRNEVTAFWNAVAEDGRMIDFEARRGGWATPRERALAVPDALLAEPEAWAGVPLIHERRLIGLVLLSSPPFRQSLDWEDYDLLRTAGRQAASSLSEAHGQQALMNAQRFEDFNRRFAFILHDIKNLVSQLSLLSRNAERHADNPDFRADMVATLKSSVGKMNDLLQRIAPKGGARIAQLRPIELRPSCPRRSPTSAVVTTSN
ncbi:PEP-CTERM system histidine kinase PrsK [Sphingomonas rhizophila]|uniref:PEP-CTERM system histidine kinase PrsK n=1 Tax=Sphingomonas rhizophila TaxID=2071607 RepID=A0A7G9SC39_9SPHN|nr:XrtA/PEP-CTERM system histidine kinase PrsK [Sphingomonas rhizophila]QNN65414.1 PEP-CTERM system histidine kinase PrsK [Sphingomonas rhizophila]